MSRRNLDHEDAMRELKADLERVNILEASAEFRWFMGMVSDMKHESMIRMSKGLTNDEYRISVGEVKALDRVKMLAKKTRLSTQADIDSRGAA